MDPLPSTKCSVCGKAWALKDRAEDDGSRRCVTHSTRPDILAKRMKAAAQGVANGAKLQGIPTGGSKELGLQVVSIEEARERKRKARALGEGSTPVSLRTKTEIQAYLEQVAGDLKDGGEPATATAAATIVKAAAFLLSLPDDKKPEDEAKQTTGFEYRVIPRANVPRPSQAPN